MYQNDCTLPLTADLFTQAVHPTQPLLAVGLASGHVECFRLPPESTSLESGSSGGRGHIDSAWRTRRHKGSCRALTFSPDGEHCYSAGTDSLIKHFTPATGHVTTKIPIPPSLASGSQPDQPSLLLAPTPQNLILACDSGSLHFYDLRLPSSAPSAKPVQTHLPHSDYVSSLTPLPASDTSTSGFPRQIISTGGTTLALTDLRKGMMIRSDDQDDELLCSVFVPGCGNRRNRGNGVLVVGTSSGVATVWDRSNLADQQDRIYVNRLESVDAVARVPGEGSTKIVAAVGNGHLSIVDVRKREVETQLTHDVDAAVAINFDCHGRMISGGGKVVKVWEDVDVDMADDGDSSDPNQDDNSEGDEAGEQMEEDEGEDQPPTSKVEEKRKRREDSGEGDSASESEDSSEDEKPKKKKKKKGRGKAKDLGAHGAHGIMGFKGL